MQYTEILEGSDAWFVARLVLPNQVSLFQGDVLADNTSAIRIRVYDISSETTDPDAAGGGLHYSQDVSSADPYADHAIILAALATDGYWNGTDDEGYNFIYRLQNSAALLEGGHRYKVEFHIKTTSFGTISWTTGLYTRSMLLE